LRETDRCYAQPIEAPRCPFPSLQGLAAILRDVTARYEEVKALKAKLAAAGKPPSTRE
jgi:hypothetical protein